jgi:hypothetical protein
MWVLHRDGILYTDKSFCKFTTKKREGYTNFAEKFAETCPGYGLDENQICFALPETKTINMKQLIDILKSKDESLLAQNEWMF